MTVNFCLYHVSRNLCLPASRQELLLEVLEKRLYGDVTHIWHHPGHIFITTDGGRKLFTFDSKPVDHENVFDTGCLDIASVHSTVIDICMASESVALVVPANGDVQCWKFTKRYDWTHLGNAELFSTPDSCVISATYLTACEKLVWCEQQRKNLSESNDDISSMYSYCIKARQFGSDFKDLSGSSTHQLFFNCPPCIITPMTADLLFIQTQHKEDQVLVTVLCTVDQKQMTMFLGNERFSIPNSTLSSGFDFSSFLKSHIPSLLKCKTGKENLGVKQCTFENRVATLTSDGYAEVYSLIKGKEQVSRHSFKFHVDDSSLDIKHWFLCSRHIGIIHQGYLLLYSIQDGQLKYRWESGDLANISSIIPSCSPSFLTWVLTNNGLYSLQISEAKPSQPYSSPEHLPHNNLLQTDILRLAHLHQQKVNGYSRDVLCKLEELRTAWMEGKNLHQVQIAEKIEPLIADYMRLENFSKSLKESNKMVPKTPESDIDCLIEREMTSFKTASKIERHAKLLWLSSAYPQSLLAHFTKAVTLDSEEISIKEMPEWQALLDLDGQDLSKFETVCRLLFVLQPEKLVHFVQCAESVNEHKIGVSAFMRKKHSLMFYKKACDCLPPAEASHNPTVAGKAYAKLILACKESKSEETALKYLLDQSLWSEAISLLKSTCRDKQILPCYLFITVSALAKNNVLVEFLTEIFEIMPSWKSFLTCSKLAMERPEIRERQLSFSATDVFQQEDTDVCIANVKTNFLRLVNDFSDNGAQTVSSGSNKLRKNTF